MTRLCTFKADEKVRLGIVMDQAVADLNLAYALSGNSASESTWPTMIDFLSGGEANIKAAKKVEKFLAEKRDDIRGSGNERGLFPLDTIKFLATIPKPPKFLCLAGNYMAHLQEGRKGTAAPPPEDIHVFTKFPGTSVIGNEDPIIVPSTIEKLDYELEIGIVIGQRGRYIPVEKAIDHIGGYTVVNDVSDRSYMPSPNKSIHWFAMKAQDNFGPIGPCLLLADDVPHPVDLSMKLWVNGELRQDARTSQMIFNPAQVVSRLSELITLEVGDVIATGTPAGNGWSRSMFLKDRDIIEAEIENIGRLRNKVVFEEPVYRKG